MPCFLFKNLLNLTFHLIPAVIYMLKVNNRKTRPMCEICSKLTIKTLERRQWSHSGIFIVDANDFILVPLLLTLNIFNIVSHPAGILILSPISISIFTKCSDSFICFHSTWKNVIYFGSNFGNNKWRNNGSFPWA